MSELVRTRVDGLVATLWLSRPGKRNALNHAMVDAAIVALTQLSEQGVRVVVLRADGAVFCAGADTTELDDGLVPASERLLDALVSFDLFFVAAIEKPALGAGVSVAAACPLVLASADAWFALPERDLGMFPSGVMAFLEPLVGPRRALELGLTGARLDAVGAQRLGLVNEVVSGSMEPALRRWLDILLADVWVTSSAAASWRTRFSTDEFRARKAVLDALLAAVDGRQL